MWNQVRYPVSFEPLDLVPNAFAEEDSLRIPDVSLVEASAELLYGLVHQRFILTRAGLHAMVRIVTCILSPLSDVYLY